MYYYQHNIGDFDLATRHLTRIERSIYRDLLDVYYETEKPLDLDLTKLCRRIIARSSEEATAVEQVLNEFFIETPNGWYHDRCEEEIDKYRNSTSQKSAAGKASAAKREEKRQQALIGIPTGVEQTLNGDPTKQETRTTKQETDKSKPSSAAPAVDLDFEAAWDAYPPRTGASKADSLKQWKARIKAGASAEQIIAGVKRYAAYVIARRTEDSYIKQPATFFGPGKHYESNWAVPMNSAPASNSQLGKAGQQTAAAAQQWLEQSNA